MSSGKTGLVLEYITKDDTTDPQAIVYWVDDEEVAELLQRIAERRHITSIADLEEIVDLVRADYHFEAISVYIPADCDCFSYKPQ